MKKAIVLTLLLSVGLLFSADVWELVEGSSFNTSTSRTDTTRTINVADADEVTYAIYTTGTDSSGIVVAVEGYVAGAWQELTTDTMADELMQVSLHSSSASDLEGINSIRFLITLSSFDSADSSSATSYYLQAKSK